MKKVCTLRKWAVHSRSQREGRRYSQQFSKFGCITFLWVECPVMDTPRTPVELKFVPCVVNMFSISGMRHCRYYNIWESGQKIWKPQRPCIVQAIVFSNCSWTNSPLQPQTVNRSDNQCRTPLPHRPYCLSLGCTCPKRQLTVPTSNQKESKAGENGLKANSQIGQHVSLMFINYSMVSHQW